MSAADKSRVYLRECILQILKKVPKLKRYPSAKWLQLATFGSNCIQTAAGWKPAVHARGLVPLIPPQFHSSQNSPKCRRF